MFHTFFAFQTFRVLPNLLHFFAFHNHPLIFLNLQPMKSRSSSIQRESSTEKPDEGRKKWTSALRVVTAVTRLKNLPSKNVSSLF